VAQDVGPEPISVPQKMSIRFFMRLIYLKIDNAEGWPTGSSSRVPTQQAQGPDFKPSATKKKSNNVEKT
jgi:hypothetical protein